MSDLLNRLRRRLAIALVAIGVGSSANAFDFGPTFSVIDAGAGRAGVTLAVSNPRSTELPVVIEVFERSWTTSGQEELVPASDAFTVFPPQALIRPGAEQSVRLQWTGSSLDTSRSFMVFAAEQPIRTGREGPRIITVLRIGATVHVTTSAQEAALAITEAVPVAEGVRVTVRNSGTRYAYISDYAMEFGATVVTGAQLSDAAGQSWLPPLGAAHTFVVPDVSGRPRLVGADG